MPMVAHIVQISLLRGFSPLPEETVGDTYERLLIQLAI